MGFLEKIFGSYSQKELKRINPIVDKVIALEDKFKAMSDSELKAMTPALKERLKNGETVDDLSLIHISVQGCVSALPSPLSPFSVGKPSSGFASRGFRGR